MSSWATFTSSFTSSPSELNLSPRSPPTPTFTHNTFHQLDRPEPLPQHRYPQAGDQGPCLQQNIAYDFDYQQLQKLVQLRESKLADCSYLTRQRKKVSVSARAPAQLKPGPPLNPKSEAVTRSGETFAQREFKIAKAPTGPEDGSRSTFQGERPTRFFTSDALHGFESSWGGDFVTDALGGSQFGRGGGFSPFRFSSLSPAGYSSEESTTDSDSELLPFGADFTWSFPISREERREGVSRSAYSFDDKGRLRGLEKSPVAIVLTPPSAPALKWRASPNDPACRPRSASLLHPMWSAKY
ncbi:hypothetical protein FS837_002483 [Tulasnella sp. UAMH 9824]|nr:hypothetical protein FS837_002483 [Tulasnella sp. UAMH 9824]